MKEVFSSIIILLFVTLIIGCSVPEDTVIQKNATNISKKNLSEGYNQALINMQDNNSNSKLDQRHDYLQNQVNKVVSGEKNLTMAVFVQTKIEVDFLRLKGYDKKKVDTLWTNFGTAFAKKEQSLDSEDESGSLNDRYYSLERKIKKIESGETKLEVVDFLQIEENLFNLEEDDYIVSRIDGLRTRLFKSVMKELENAIVEFEPPKEPVIVEEEETEKEVAKEEDKVVEEEAILMPDGTQKHVVFLWDGGFDTDTLKIKVGDTVEWMNTREAHINIALVLGNRECRDVKSSIFDSGYSYNYTFTKPGTCYISDGIFTTQAMRILVRK